ncbi:MAG: OmpA family protein [Planctomycetes bacterium]|nr:OmpA family protein [Planctomycetota bacterium]
MIRTFTVAAGAALMLLLSAGCVEAWHHRRLQGTYNQAMDHNRQLRGQVQGLAGENATLKDRLAAKDTSADSRKVADALKDEGGRLEEGMDLVRLTLHDQILFATGEATLRADGKEKLDRIADKLKTNMSASQYIRVDGHTDNVPVRATAQKWPGGNVELSGARAEAVHAYLVSKGVKPDRLFFAGFGEHHPAKSNETEAGRAANRRVEIVVGAKKALGLVD